MADVTYEQVLELVEQLNPTDQLVLANHIHREHGSQLTREALDAIFERRKREGVKSENLAGKYANPDVDLSYEELEATIREASNAWMEDFDEL